MFEDKFKVKRNENNIQSKRGAMNLDENEFSAL